MPKDRYDFKATMNYMRETGACVIRFTKMYNEGLPVAVCGHKTKMLIERARWRWLRVHGEQLEMKLGQ